MKHLLSTTAILAAGLLAFGATAQAGPIAVTGTYTITLTNSNHGPTITDILSNPFTENLTVGVATTATQFFSAAPNNSHSGSATITAAFTFTAPTAGTGSDTASFVSNPFSHPQSDSITWASGNDPIEIDFTNGAVLDITLNNASDWTLYPTISFKLLDGPSSVPEPAALALLGSGLLGLGLIRRRHNGA